MMMMRGLNLTMLPRSRLEFDDAEIAAFYWPESRANQNVPEAWLLHENGILYL